MNPNSLTVSLQAYKAKTLQIGLQNPVSIHDIFYKLVGQTVKFTTKQTGRIIEGVIEQNSFGYTLLSKSQAKCLNFPLNFPVKQFHNFFELEIIEAEKETSFWSLCLNDSRAMNSKYIEIFHEEENQMVSQKFRVLRRTKDKWLLVGDFQPGLNLFEFEIVTQTRYMALSVEFGTIENQFTTRVIPQIKLLKESEILNYKANYRRVNSDVSVLKQVSSKIEIINKVIGFQVCQRFDFVQISAQKFRIIYDFKPELAKLVNSILTSYTTT
jgi:ferredoxin-fold anticodon binding domain-containing protein